MIFLTDLLFFKPGLCLAVICARNMSKNYEHCTNFEEAKLPSEQLVDDFKGRVKD